MPAWGKPDQVFAGKTELTRAGESERSVITGDHPERGITPGLEVGEVAASFQRAKWLDRVRLDEKAGPLRGRIERRPCQRSAERCERLRVLCLIDSGASLSSMAS